MILPLSNAVGGVVRAEAINAPRLLASICHSGPCAVLLTPVVDWPGRPAVSMAVLPKVAGKWNVLMNCPVREVSGAWLCDKNAAARANAAATSLSVSPRFDDTLRFHTRSTLPMRSVIAIARFGVFTDCAAAVTMRSMSASVRPSAATSGANDVALTLAVRPPLPQAARRSSAAGNAEHPRPKFFDLGVRDLEATVIRMSTKVESRPPVVNETEGLRRTWFTRSPWFAFLSANAE